MIMTIILIILLFLSAFFSGMETAFFSVSEIRLRSLVKIGKRGAKRVLDIKTHPQKFITTILFGNNLVNIAASALATVIFTDMFGSKGVGIATGVMTLLVLVFGEITPKTLCNQYAMEVCLIAAPIINFLSFLFAPFVWFFTKITNIVMLLFKTPKKAPLVTEEELRTMAEIGASEQEIEEAEKRLIQNVFMFNDITAKEVMTPRPYVQMLDGEKKLSEVLNVVIKSPFSRLPLFTKNRDNIVGVLYVKDAFRHLKKRNTRAKLSKIAVKPFFIPEKITINELFKEFQRKRLHIAIVVDEYGGFSGLVTMEDLLEELVGEIIDESDIEMSLIKRIDKNTIVAHGKTEIKHINSFFNTTIPSRKHRLTISGFIMYKLKKIPKPGHTFQTNGLQISIEDASERKILKVKIKKLDI